MNKYYVVDHSNQIIAGVGLMLTPLLFWVVYTVAFSPSHQLSEGGVQLEAVVTHVEELGTNPNVPDGPFDVSYRWAEQGKMRVKTIRVNHTTLNEAPYKKGDPIRLIYHPDQPDHHVLDQKSDPRIWNYGIIITVICALIGVVLTFVGYLIHKMKSLIPAQAYDPR